MPASGSTITKTCGSTSAENSRKTRALWPLATTVSISRTAWVSQTTPVKISTKKPKAADQLAQDVAVQSGHRSCLSFAVSRRRLAKARESR